MTPAATLLAGRFRLDEPIGSGGFCEVWRATDTVLSRPVAVKLLHPGYAQQAEALGRFRAEARHAASLSHPNIARVYDYGDSAGGQPPYLVMELIDGPSLAQVLAGGPLDAARTMDVVAQAAAGLGSAHASGLVHRDIKPGNILFTPGGTVRITDFGIAYAIGSAPVTGTGTVMGTPGYIAPERVAGGAAGAASDLYALGVVAYECLAGAPPFAGTALEVATAHRDCPLPPLPASAPAEVVAFVMTMTAKDPAWRPGSAAEVADRAARLRDDLRAPQDATRLIPAKPTLALPLTTVEDPPIPGPPMPGMASPRPAASTRLRRRRALIGAAALAMAALVGLLASMTGFGSIQHPANGPSSAPPSASQPASTPSSASPGTGASAGPGHKHGHRHGNQGGD